MAQVLTCAGRVAFVFYGWFIPPLSFGDECCPSLELGNVNFGIASGDSTNSVHFLQTIESMSPSRFCYCSNLKRTKCHRFQTPRRKDR